MYSTFVEECIARAPLIGINYEADTRQFHQLILSSTQGKPLHKLIEPLMKKTNGRIYMSALRAHHQGEGNTKRCIADSERLCESLHYRNERGLPFASYLSKMQQIFTLFKDNKEPYSDAMKLRFLYDTIKHPQLITTVSTLQVGQIAGNTVSFTGVCGHLATMVSKFPESQITKRSLSFVEGYHDRKGGNAKVPNDLFGIRTGNGEIYTGYYADFFQLSKANQEKGSR